MDKGAKIRVDLYGQLADIAGTDTLEFEEVSDSAQLIELINQQYPRFKNLKYKLAVDKKIIDSDTAISSASKIALLPPFSGG